MMTKTRKKRTVILSTILVLVIIIGGTLAYLSSTTEEKTNTFSFSENIRGKLDEPNWDPNSGKDLVPGAEMKKDPMITNKSSHGVEEFAAIRVVFTAGDGTVLDDTQTARLLGLITIDWNTGTGATEWTRIDSNALTGNTQVYVYNSAIKPGEVTVPLFNVVTIKENITEEDFSWLAGIVMTHTDDCFEYNGAHGGTCTISYNHHKKCALFDGVNTSAAIAQTPQDQTLGAVKCNCKVAEVHDEDCPSLVATLKATCTHTPENGALGGFQLKVKGAVVQANVDGMDSATDTVTITNILSLF